MNYALYMHTLEKDYDQASEVYKRGAQIAKRHPVLLYVLVPWCHGLPRHPDLGAASRCMPHPPCSYGFGIFLLSQNKYPRKRHAAEAQKMIGLARQLDPRGERFELALQVR